MKSQLIPRLLIVFYILAYCCSCSKNDPEQILNTENTKPKTTTKVDLIDREPLPKETQLNKNTASLHPPQQSISVNSNSLPSKGSYIESTPNNAVTKNAVKAKLIKNNKKPKIALIVDDLGYNVEKVKRLTNINLPVTLALIPDTPYAKAVAKHAHNKGYELMLHVPMETISERKWEQGLTNNMERQQFDSAVAKMLSDYPNAKGMNNHGGSLLTQQREKMDWLMGELAAQELYFVDSRTIASSVAGKAAGAAGLTELSRDVFLDNNREHQAIEKELRRLQTIAYEQGQAIGIAHPYKETLEVLEKLLPQINSEGFEFVFVSQLNQKPG